MAKINVIESDCFGYYTCPVCGDDDIELGQKHCKNCGEPIEWEEE